MRARNGSPVHAWPLDRHHIGMAGEDDARARRAGPITAHRLALLPVSSWTSRHLDPHAPRDSPARSRRAPDSSGSSACRSAIRRSSSSVPVGAAVMARAIGFAVASCHRFGADRQWSLVAARSLAPSLIAWHPSFRDRLPMPTACPSSACALRARRSCRRRAVQAGPREMAAAVVGVQGRNPRRGPHRGHAGPATQRLRRRDRRRRASS